MEDKEKFYFAFEVKKDLKFGNEVFRYIHDEKDGFYVEPKVGINVKVLGGSKKSEEIFAISTYAKEFTTELRDDFMIKI